MTILSSLPDATGTIQIEQKDKNNIKANINCLKTISAYNTNMGFIDKFNQLISLYKVDCKHKMWLHQIFYHFLDVAIINNYILHKMKTAK